MADEQETPKKQSYILVQFKEIGSVMLFVQVEGVTPLQMMAAASMLEVKGKNAYILQENERIEQEARMKLSVPNPMEILVGKK